MRSEKEIKEAQKKAEKEVFQDNSIGCHSPAQREADTLEWVLEGEPRYTLREFQENGLIVTVKDLKIATNNMKRLEEFLKEPRYSVAELEKIENKIESLNLFKEVLTTQMETEQYYGGVEQFIEFLKDSKRVQEALK